MDKWLFDFKEKIEKISNLLVRKHSGLLIILREVWCHERQDLPLYVKLLACTINYLYTRVILIETCLLSNDVTS